MVNGRGLTTGDEYGHRMKRLVRKKKKGKKAKLLIGKSEFTTCMKFPGNNLLAELKNQAGPYWGHFKLLEGVLWKKTLLKNQLL